MTGLDIAQVLKDEQTRLSEEISRLTRRRGVMQAAATKLRLGYSTDVILAEIRSQGESVPGGVE